MDKRVIIIGLDGMRSDSFLKAHTPAIEGLTGNGIFSWDGKTEAVTVSGSAWTSLLTGVHVAKHKVVGNDFSFKDNDYRTIFSLAKKWKPELKSVAHSGWESIISQIFEHDALDIKDSGSDYEMAKRMTADIKNDLGHLYFIQFDNIDATGHSSGYSPDSPEYIKSIETTDSYVGQIMEAINQRPENEKWFIALVSDHGGVDKGHGNPSPEEITIVFILSGKNICISDDLENTIKDQLHIVDVVPAIADFLGMKKLDCWDGINPCKNFSADLGTS